MPSTISLSLHGDRLIDMFQWRLVLRFFDIVNLWSPRARDHWNTIDPGTFICINLDLYMVIRAGVAQWVIVGLPNNSYKPITNTAWVWAQLCKLQKIACPWSVVLSGYSSFFHHLNGCHDIAEILLKVTLNTKKSNQIILQ
jgi:hypothetical protein